LLAAGFFADGNTKRRQVKNCVIDNCLTAGVYVQDSLTLTRIVVRGNTDAGATRNAYGLAYDGVDNHWQNVTSQWSHCPLLTTGATLMMVDCDLFNGGSGGSPPTDPHLWEHYGNTITWIGGRLGNGFISIYNTDLTIHPSKIGVTTGAVITSYFKFYANSASQECTNFTLFPQETPSELRTGSTAWFDFANAVTFTANTVNTSPTISNVSAFTGLVQGQAISGAGIPGGTTITTIDTAAKTITMSANASATATGITVTPAGTWISALGVLASMAGYPQITPRELKLIKTESNNIFVERYFHAGDVDDAVLGFNTSSTTEIQMGMKGGFPFIGYFGTASNHLDRRIIKTAAETVTSSTTLQSDNDLLFAIAASVKYRFRFDVYYSSPAAADFKFDLDSTAAGAPTVTHVAIDSLVPDGTARVSVMHSAVNTTVSLLHAANTLGHVIITGFIENSANAGNLRLRWAQNTSNAGNTQVLNGSTVHWSIIE
jgi:hypothetical protein